jgi:hypothetical protein
MTQIPSFASIEQLTELKDINAMLARITKRRTELGLELELFVQQSANLDASVRNAEQLA